MEEHTRLVYRIAKIMNLNKMRMLVYEKAFRLMGSSVFKSQAEQCVFQSNNNISRIRSIMYYYDMDPEYANSISCTLYRRWICLKMQMNRNDDRAIMKYCLETEQALARQYRLILKNELLSFYFPMLRPCFLKHYHDTCEITQYLRTALEPHHDGVPVLKLKLQKKLTLEFTEN